MLYDSFIITKKPLKKRNILLQCIAFVTIWSVLPAVVMIHVVAFLYQAIYFSILDIPKVRVREYVTFDRKKLQKLNIVQRFGCMYCAYTNGIAAWTKIIANRTELYSCAIKHKTPALGQEHQKDFYAYQDFE